VWDAILGNQIFEKELRRNCHGISEDASGCKSICFCNSIKKRSIRACFNQLSEESEEEVDSRKVPDHKLPVCLEEESEELDDTRSREPRANFVISGELRATCECVAKPHDRWIMALVRPCTLPRGTKFSIRICIHMLKYLSNMVLTRPKFTNTNTTQLKNKPACSGAQVRPYRRTR
jgi:hypothetical protein